MLQRTDVRPMPTKVLRIGFWLSDAFDFYALASALEPLRLANERAGQTVCEWQMLSHKGHPLKASNGITMATQALDPTQPFDVLMHLAGVGPQVVRRLMLELFADDPCQVAPRLH